MPTTMTQQRMGTRSLNRPLECVWLLAEEGLKCVWVEIPQQDKTREETPEEDAGRMVA